MDLFKAEQMAKSLMAEHLDTRVWSFKWNRRAGSFGLCCYKDNTISLSSVLTPHETEEATRQTILHEIAHALTPGQGHNIIWKRKAMQLGVVRPRGQRQATAPDLGGVEKLRGVKHVMVYGDKIVKTYMKRPAQKTYERLPHIFLKNDPLRTKGRLKIVPIDEHLRCVKEVKFY